MDSIQDRLRKRNSEQLIYSTYQLAIEKERVERGKFLKVRDAFFNHSMWIYYLLASVNFTLWYLFVRGVIG